MTGGNKQRISKSKQKLESSCDHLINPGSNYCGSNSDILSVENEERIAVDEGSSDDKIN